MWPKGMGDLAVFNVREVKKAAAEERDLYSLGVKVKSKVIPMSFLEVEEKGRFVGAKAGKRGTLNGIGR